MSLSRSSIAHSVSFSLSHPTTAAQPARRFNLPAGVHLSMVGSEHPHLILHEFLSPDLCKELEFIHKSCSTISYRENVFSTTLSHLIATNSPHLIIPYILIRVF